MASSVRLLRSTGIGSRQLAAPPPRRPTLARALAVARHQCFSSRAPLHHPAARTDQELLPPAAPPVTPEPRAQPAAASTGTLAQKRPTGAREPAAAGSTTDAPRQQDGAYDVPLQRSSLPAGDRYDSLWAQCLESSQKLRQELASRGVRLDSPHKSWGGLISDRPDLALQLLFVSPSLPWLAGGQAPPQAALAMLLHKSPVSKRAQAVKVIDLATEQFDDPAVLSGAIKLLTRQHRGPDTAEAFAKLERRVLEVGPTWQGRGDANLFAGGLSVIDSVRPGFQSGAHGLTFEAAWLFTVCFGKVEVQAHRRRLHQLFEALRGVRGPSRPRPTDVLGFLDPSVRWASRDPITALYILHFYIRLRQAPIASSLQLPERIKVLVDGLGDISADEWAAMPGPQFAEWNAWGTAKDLLKGTELRSALKQNAAEMDALFKRFETKPSSPSARPTARRRQPKA